MVIRPEKRHQSSSFPGCLRAIVNQLRLSSADGRTIGFHDGQCIADSQDLHLISVGIR
jgi:hypothetical protein